MWNGNPSQADVNTLKKAKKVCDQYTEHMRKHPEKMNAGMFYVASDASRAIRTLIDAFQS